MPPHGGPSLLLCRILRLGWKTGLEPATPGITIRCSNQLSYIHRCIELRGHRFDSSLKRSPFGIPASPSPSADRLSPTRTRMARPTELHPPSIVGHHLSGVARPAGLEPATTGLEGRCSIRLSYGRSFRILHPPSRVRPMARRRLVGVEGFEPPTLCSQSRCATRLRYTPMDQSRLGRSSTATEAARRRGIV